MNTQLVTTAIKEQKKHGSEEFPLQVYRDVTTYEKGNSIYNHWHEEIEILYVTEGEMEVIINGIATRVGKGTVILIPPNQLHTAFQMNEGIGCFTSIVFHPNFIASRQEDRIQKMQIEPFLVNDFTISYILNLTEEGSTMVQNLLQDFLLHFEKQGENRELLLKGILIQIFYYLLQHKKVLSHRTVSDYQKENRKKEILTFIRNHYSEPVTLDDMAAQLNLSREQFCRFFRQAFRTSPMHYLNQYRVSCAKNMLKEGKYSVTEIAGMTGYESSNYFSIIFKKITGMSPSQYKKMTQI